MCVVALLANLYQYLIMFHNFVSAVLTGESSNVVTVCCLYLQREHLKIAQQYFQLVGGSASEAGLFIFYLLSLFVKSKSVKLPNSFKFAMYILQRVVNLSRSFEITLLYS